MMNIKNKKGSQVAIILSIVIFIGFFIFLYIILIPKVAIENNKDLVANLLDYKLTEELSEELITVTLVFNEDYNFPGDKDCMEIDHISGFAGLNVFARDYDSSLKSLSNSETLEIEVQGNNEFFKIYYTEASFESTLPPTNCHSLTIENNYKIGLIKTTQEVFESKILDYITYYNDDYGDLKEQLDLSTGKEFYFKFIYDNGTSISPTERNTYGGLYVQQKNIKYIDVEANKKMGVLEIWVW